MKLTGGRAGVSGRPLVFLRGGGVARAGTAREWVPARGLGMATFANPFVSPPSRKARWLFCIKADTPWS
ncbi:hypothetical protein GALLR39Z86_01080 [Glycomyces algeriensis]|uniref:Uncharacterized protein n=1 Tax=Glycomyces algeriensis TaxID=256037 RepID=A0A9W6LE17_9ACTN|nr:hypothetical protein GALLR39Z86_01080 [Glycomyces algeriensis]